jgi:hypothetical protein
MGFFKKVFKKVKKGFKSIGKGIKSAFKKIGKFMGKIGIVGQLALMFTPVGAMMGNLFSGIGNAAGQAFRGVTGALAQGGKIAQAAGKVLEAGGSFAKAGHSAFKTVTQGVETFVKEFGGAALNTIPGMNKLMPSITDKSFESAWNATQESVLQNSKSIMTNFENAINGRMPTASQQAALDAKKAAAKITKSDYVESKTKAMQEQALKFPDSIDERFKSSDVSSSTTSEITKSDYVESKTNAMQEQASKFPDSSAFDVSGTGKQMVAESGGIQIDKPTFEKQQSLLGNPTDYASTKYKEFLDDRPLGQAITEESIDYLGEQVAGMPDDMVALGKQRLAQKAGLMPKVEGNTTHVSAVAQFDTAPAGTYGSPEINDRAMQVQLAGTDFYNLAPWGAGANFYTQTMARGIGGSA